MSIEHIEPIHNTPNEAVIDEVELRKNVLARLAQEKPTPEQLEKIRAKLISLAEKRNPVDWEKVKKATEYRLAESKYLSSLKGVDEGRHSALLEMAQYGKEFPPHHFWYLEGANASRAWQLMQRIRLNNQFIIGGADEQQAVLTSLTYNPEMHKPFMTRPGQGIPPEGENITIASAEVGYIGKGGYRQVLPPVYCLPNGSGGIDSSTFRSIHLIAADILSNNQ